MKKLILQVLLRLCGFKPSLAPIGARQINHPLSGCASDKNGNRISQETKNEKLAYIYDTENRLLAVKDKKGLLMAALYDGDDNRVFTASRKEGKNAYQLFRRKEKKKSPQTSPNGEEPSLFWYGFSQNVLQSLSSFPQTVGSIWHSIFDDVSSAYHQKVAKDQATKDGLVVNPPSLGNLPGEGDVTYASQVKDVLIPYTTREDTYEYYEERNYVNDINREHTEVLQTYDHDLKARETYSYGHGRNSYLHHQTNETYQYLTNQAGSVTGLTKDGELAASSSYTLYGSTKSTTDETGNPYAYNGEARDGTGLDYLRARYYDSVAGTFLTEDSYQGEASDPLSQNRYAYVRNNPVNYTDPSGHRFVLTTMGGGRKQSPIASAFTAGIKRFASMLVAPIRTAVQFASVSIKAATATVRYTMVKAHPHHYTDTQKAKIKSDYLAAVGAKVAFKIREAGNLTVNWTRALAQTLRHVCNPKSTKGKDNGTRGVTSVADFRKLEDALKVGLTPEDKAKIDKMSIDELENKYSYLRSLNPYQGVSSLDAKSRPYIISRYNQLRQQLHEPPSIKDNPTYQYYDSIINTGRNPYTGEKVSDFEIRQAKINRDIVIFGPIIQAGVGAWAWNAQATVPKNRVKAVDVVDDVSDTSRAFKASDTVDDVSDISRGVGNPVPVLGKGSTGRTVANTLNEQLAMQEVMSNPLAGAFEVPVTMTDPRWMGTEGWVKMQKIVTLSDGTKVNIHYVYNKITGVFDDFKFK